MRDTLNEVESVTLLEEERLSEMDAELLAVRDDEVVGDGVDVKDGLPDAVTV